MWQNLKKKTPKGVEWTRVEARVGAGMPDINGVMTSGEFWLELKVCKTKKYKTEGLWRPTQIAWQHKRAGFYKNVWNVVSHPAEEVINVYRCDSIMDLNMSQESPEPDLVLTYPVDWNDLLEHIHNELFKNRTGVDYECADG